jgi:hypothetical protein
MDINRTDSQPFGKGPAENFSGSVRIDPLFRETEPACQLSKNFRITESKSLQLRMDATNIMNHPTPGDPVGLQPGFGSFSNNFGQITTKTGNRVILGQLRFNF